MSTIPTLSILTSIASAPPRGIRLPKPLEALERLATNLYWTWHPEVQDLFSRVDPNLWAQGVGPVSVLQRAKDLEMLAGDPAFVADVQTASTAFDAYMASAESAWHGSRGLKAGGGPIAYFCAEYGFHESLNQYAGGLGILAGDHCKEASDMGLPFVAVGLFYRRGFFHQMVDWEGRQEHEYPVLDPVSVSVCRVLKPGTEEPLSISIEMPGRTVSAAVWLAPVGRVPLLLLDTDVANNRPEDRCITSQLYTNSREMRLHQEAVLGVGGVRALRALGIHPSVWHLNEGHSALLLLERLRESMAQGSSLEAARSTVARDSIITIHTPVPEGNERFDARLARRIIEPIVQGTQLTPAAALQLGLGADANPDTFDMTAFALRHTRSANGVSLLHGRTADATWKGIAGYNVIGITNGVHMPTWIGPELKKVYAAAGASLDATTGSAGREPWTGVSCVSDAELWQAHLRQKAALIDFARQRLLAQHARHGEGPDNLRQLVDSLNPDAFIIGFARRFATYKRASLLFTDESRLARLLDAPGRPVQILFSGKSHPSDRGGQALIQQVYAKTQVSPFRGKVFLLEDYDIEVARFLVQGADVWLNNPRRPLEASGTSGMKAAANGLPNVSILDGWWDEAYVESTRNGWAIGGRETVPDTNAQDQFDADALYRILEEEVIPAYFERDASGLPTRWLPVMRQAIATSVRAFSTRRMLVDYLEQMIVG